SGRRRGIATRGVCRRLRERHVAHCRSETTRLSPWSSAQLAWNLPISLLPQGEGAPEGRMRERTCEPAEDVDWRCRCREYRSVPRAGADLPAASLIWRYAPPSPGGRREGNQTASPVPAHADGVAVGGNGACIP